MRSSFMGLTTLLRALQAQQQAMDVTNQNIANANTTGYTRQEAKLVQTAPHAGSGYNRPVGGGLMMGTGVMVSEIMRQRDSFVDQQLRTETAQQKKWQVISDGVQQVEALFNEPSTNGLGNQLTTFFNAWSELSTNPGSATARAQLQTQAQTVVAAFQDLSQQLESFRQNQDFQLTSVVSEVNDLATQIASLNLQIRRSTAVGDNPNDLMDARDRLIDQVMTLTGATYQEQTDGSTTVRLGGRILVDGTKANALVAELTPLASGKTSHTIEWSPGGTAVAGLGGTVGALVHLRDNVVSDKVAKLNLLASTIVTSVNAQHAQGRGLGQYASSTTNTDFFSTQRTTTPLRETGLGDTLVAGSFKVGTDTISVDPTTDSLDTVMNKITAAMGPSATWALNATTGRIVITSPTSPSFASSGDTSNFLQVTGIQASGVTSAGGTGPFTATAAFPLGIVKAATLALDPLVATDTQAIRASGTTTSGGQVVSAGAGDSSNALKIVGLATTQWSSLGSATFDDFYASMIGSLGIESRQATQMATNQTALVDHLTARRESTSGVNLDEEAAQLIRFQRAYQAAARGITALDEILSQTINSMGRVGL
jgi:flagellar hook-associated protein 1 FlgK